MLSLDPPSFDLGLEQIYKSSEGIDLASNELKHAFIGRLGTPQLNLSNKHVSSVLQEKFDDDYDFTYTYPGIKKEIQAAGRVTCKTSDEGYLWLLDQRFEQPQIKRLMRELWF